MTVLYQTNFEAETAGVTPAGWIGVGDFRTYTWVERGFTAIGGTKGIFSAYEFDSGLYTGIAAQGDQAARVAFRVPSLTTAGHRSWAIALRSNSGLTQHYRIRLESDDTALRLSIYNYNSGIALLASSSTYSFAPAPGDLVHLEALAIGTTISARAWIEGTTRPATISGSGTSTATYATATVTSALYATGYAGIQLIGTSGTWFGADHFVVTDGAGGEDYFYAPPPDPVATIAWTEGADVIAAAVNVTISGVSIAAAWTEGADVVAMTGTAAGAAIGTITTDQMTNNAVDPLANETGVIANVYNVSTGQLVVQKTGLTSNALGVVVISDALIVAGTSYSYEIVLTSNGRRLPVAVAA